jgi:hypothetical protein
MFVEQWQINELVINIIYQQKLVIVFVTYQIRNFTLANFSIKKYRYLTYFNTDYLSSSMLQIPQIMYENQSIGDRDRD